MPEKPLVVHIITRLEPGGSSRNVIDSCAAQAADFSVALLSGPHPASAPLLALLPPDVKYVEIKHLGREISPLADLRALAEIRAQLAALGPDLVHTHTSKAGALGRLAAFLHNRGAARRAAVVHTPHGHLLYGYYGPARTRLFLSIERLLARITDRFVALTEGEKRESAGAGIGREADWAVIHSGVDLTPPASPARKEDLGLPPDCLAAGTVARLEPVKGVEYFIRAAAILKDRPHCAALRFAVIGGGALEGRLKKLAADLGVADRVAFTGFRDDAAALMAALDIYVQPSLNEAMGRAPLEAQALGIPAVVSRVCGLPDVIREGETGCSVPPADAGALADAIEKLAAFPEARARKGAAAAAWALSRGEGGLTRFGADSMNALLKKFYNELLARRR